MQPASGIGIHSRRFKIAGLGVLGCLLLIPLGFAWHQLFSAAQKVMQMTAGARYVTVTLPGDKKPSLNFVCFDAGKFKMRVVSNPDPRKHLHIADMAKAAGAIAGCNGGYFDTVKFTPSGLGIAGGVSQGAFQSSGTAGALLGVKNGMPFIAAETEFRASPEITDLVQCSPMLVDEGFLFHNGSSATTARTFVMTDGEGQWAIGTGDHLTLDQLASLLARPGLVEGFHVRRAMNLDGGPSTGLWWMDVNGQEHEQRERWSVANMVLVVPR